MGDDLVGGFTITLELVLGANNVHINIFSAATLIVSE